MQKRWFAVLGSAVLLPCAIAQSEIAPEMIKQIEEAEQTQVRFGSDEMPAKPAGAIRLSTYNVQNLFDGLDDPAYSGDVEDLDDEKPLHELVEIARAMRAVDADILCLEEVESAEALEAFRDRFLSGMGYEYLVSLDAGGPRGIEQAVLSRFPIGEVINWPGKELGGVHPEKYGDRINWYAGEPIAFRRSPMVVQIKIPSNEGHETSLALVVVHHKSGYYNSYWREAESKGLVEILEPMLADPNANLVVLGDFNAEPGDDSVKTYLSAGFRDAFAGQEEEDSILSHESGRRIDLILMSKSVAERVVEGSARVYGTPARPEGIDWRELPTFVGYGSDHYPVAVDLWTQKPGE